MSVASEGGISVHEKHLILVLSATKEISQLPVLHRRMPSSCKVTLSEVALPEVYLQDEEAATPLIPCDRQFWT